MTSYNQYLQTVSPVMAAKIERPALRRALHSPRLAVFLGGVNLILIQWVLVRELTTLLLGTELVVLLVSVAYFAGLSVGYWASSWVKRSWFAPLGIVTLALHLSLPIWFRLLVSALDSAGAYWAAFLALPILTPFCVSAFYSILLPMFVDNTDASAHETLPTLYALELFGSMLGVVTLVALGGLGVVAVYSFYGINLLTLLVVLRVRPMLIVIAAVLAVGWGAAYPRLNDWSNALWYQELRDLPDGSQTLFTAYTGYQKVDVLQDPSGNRYLYLDGLLHFGTNRWSRLNVMMGSVPAELLSPERTLVVGAGSMQVERLIAERGGHVTTVELDPVVVDAATRFFNEYNLMGILPNRSVVIDDAKHFVANTDQHYDLVVTDVPAAFSIQTATLYSVPFYEEIARHLAPNGVLVVNLTTRLEEDRDVSRRIAASLLTVFEDVVIVTSESSSLSYAYASNDLPFDLVQLQMTLEANGESEYTLFHHDSIEQIAGDARPISLDSMDIVLQISAEWIADRLSWR